ncbi:MAG: hypothetical protein ACI965_000376, partial [Paraglaciecola sp.]
RLSPSINKSFYPSACQTRKIIKTFAIVGRKTSGLSA